MFKKEKMTSFEIMIQFCFVTIYDGNSASEVLQIYDLIRDYDTVMLRNHL